MSRKLVLCFAIHGLFLFHWKTQHAQAISARERRDNKTCRTPCRCPVRELSCANGVNIVKDGCNCCYMCARQHGDICNLRDKCDYGKGLYCDMNPGQEDGICRAYSPKPCIVNGIKYGDGQKFQPHCSQMCTCQNGRYGCVNLCPQEDRQPSILHCSNPTLMPVPDKCCKEWTCEIRRRPASGKSPRHLTQAQNLVMNPNDIENNIPGYNLQNTHQQCAVNFSEWGHCKVTCGVGVSTRTANQNCQETEETQLCYLRPCGKIVTTLNRRKCTPTTKSAVKERIFYQDCRSVKQHRLKFCTNCKKRRCCYPRKTFTKTIEFECSGGRRRHFKFMWIKSCRCDRKCYETDWDDNYRERKKWKMLNYLS